MSFETITIERRLPILNKKFVKSPNKETTARLIDIENVLEEDERLSTLSFGVKERRGVIPFFQKNSNLDFITYERIGTDGRTVSDNDIVDFQSIINNIS